jgi:hypothetical protein
MLPQQGSAAPERTGGYYCWGIGAYYRHGSLRDDAGLNKTYKLSSVVFVRSRTPRAAVMTWELLEKWGVKLHHLARCLFEYMSLAERHLGSLDLAFERTTGRYLVASSSGGKGRFWTCPNCPEGLGHRDGSLETKLVTSMRAEKVPRVQQNKGTPGGRHISRHMAHR